MVDKGQIAYFRNQRLICKKVLKLKNLNQGFRCAIVKIKKFQGQLKTYAEIRKIESKLKFSKILIKNYNFKGLNR
jgi:hypothetical protein